MSVGTQRETITSRGNFYAKREGGGKDVAIQDGEVLRVIEEDDKIIKMLKKGENRRYVRCILMIKDAPLYNRFLG
jgi:hypothetical protein